MANELLYQIGVQLVPDTNGANPNSSAVQAVDGTGQPIPGVFTIGGRDPADVNNVPTSSANDTAANAAAAFNEVDRVINIVYINSIGMDAKGNGTDWGLVVNTPGSAQSTVTLNNMLQVGQGSTLHTMHLIQGQGGTGGIGPGDWSMLLGNITPADYAISPDAENFPTAFMGNTIAHEVGHILGFLHRGTQQNTGVGDPFKVDGLPYDLSNVMLGITPVGFHALYSDDFDLVQAYAVQYSNAIAQSGS